MSLLEQKVRNLIFQCPDVSSSGSLAELEPNKNRSQNGRIAERLSAHFNGLSSITRTMARVWSSRTIPRPPTTRLIPIAVITWRRSGHHLDLRGKLFKVLARFASLRIVGFEERVAFANFEAGIFSPAGTPKCRCKAPLSFVAPAIQVFAMRSSL